MAFERIMQKDWYKILGAKPSDSPAEIKRKYQKLVLLYHPDKQKADAPAGEVEERVQRFIEIDQAWKILGNEETKKELINLSDEPASVFLDPALETMELQNPFTSSDRSNRRQSQADCTPPELKLGFQEDNLTKEWPLHAQIYLEDMSWNEDEQCYTLSCRCGGNYTVFKSESKEISLVCCDTCSLVIEILQ